MDRWTNKVAVVTGASSGIGAQICRDLVAAGMTVCGLARRLERLDELIAELPADSPGRLLAIQCDISDDAEVGRAFERIAELVGTVHVLVNNAGIVRLASITGDDANVADMKQTLQTNLWGTVEVTRRAVQLMKRTQVVGAHVVFINSVAGHKVPNVPVGECPLVNVYPSSKYGVTALAQVLQLEFNADRRRYKVTSISPGGVRTEIIPDEYLEHMEFLLNVKDVSDAVLYVLGTPPNVHIAELTIKPLGELF